MQISKAPAAIWHKQLTHYRPEVLEHLPTSVTGVKLANGPITTEYKIYTISKTYKIISQYLLL